MVVELEDDEANEEQIGLKLLENYVDLLIIS
jgi:hypothetical protein